MSQDFQPGDYLVFQVEAGFGLLRLLDVDETESGKIWHVAAYRDLFLDTEQADAAISGGGKLMIDRAHLALTTRAFEATQTARMGNVQLNAGELEGLEQWRASEDRDVSDLSVRLLLGLR